MTLPWTMPLDPIGRAPLPTPWRTLASGWASVPRVVMPAGFSESSCGLGQAGQKWFGDQLADRARWPREGGQVEQADAIDLLASRGLAYQWPEHLDGRADRQYRTPCCCGAAACPGARCEVTVARRWASPRRRRGMNVHRVRHIVVEGDLDDLGLHPAHAGALTQDQCIPPSPWGAHDIGQHQADPDCRLAHQASPSSGRRLARQARSRPCPSRGKAV